MALPSGTRFGPYEIAGEIGAGGMGVVYRATDTTLDRDVAIKVLPESMASDAERISRFDREAKTLASLNHPNIAQIYGLERSDGTTALVMELVEGATLEDRVKQGALPPDEALGIAMQIAEALEAAHGQNIVHRDLKPANIKLRPDGLVKVLDFGIAKALAPENLTSEPQSPIMTTPATQVGVILGTAAYMSPEQAKGKAVDQRTDIWAFGCVLYEMLTGQLAFGAEDVATTLARVIDRDTDLDSLPAGVSPAVRRTIELCLRKDPNKRVRDIGDARLALEGAFETVAPQLVESTAALQPMWQRMVPLAAALVVGGVLAGFAAWNLQSEAPVATVGRMVYTLPEGQQISREPLPLLDISPDGAQVVYVANQQLYVRNLDEWEARPVPGTDEGPLMPFFSPDGQWLGYWSSESRQLRKIVSSGGTPVTLADTTRPNGSPVWGIDETIVWAESQSVMTVSANGGVPEILVAPAGDRSIVRPQILPGGDSVLFFAAGAGSDVSEVQVHSLASGDRKTLFAGIHPQYVPTGHLIYALDGVLFAVPFDPVALEVTGGPVPVVEGVRGGRQYAIADSGSLVYVPGDSRGNDRILALVDRNGRVERLNVPPKEYLSPRLSPDGRTLIVQSVEESGNVLWSYDLDGDSAIQQLTFAGDSHRPVWTPDGERIAFSSDRDGTMSLYWMPADGSGVAERLTTAEEGTSHWMGSWSPNGEALVFNVQRTLTTDWDIWSLSIDDRETQSLYDAPGTAFWGPELSPDGAWLAYGSGPRSNDVDIYVEPFPPTGARRRISQAGGYFPLWSPRGDELFYRPVSTTAGITLRSVDIVTTPSFGFSNEQAFPVEGISVVGYYRDYDMTPDGERLVVMLSADLGESGAQARDQVNIVLNWFEELEQRVPVP